MDFNPFSPYTLDYKQGIACITQILYRLHK